MHGAIVLDITRKVIRPAILWNDGRATAECAALTAAVPGLAEIAGVIAMPGFTAPKLLWLRAHEPENFARIRHILLAKDFVRLRLTGEIATDMTDAAGTLMLDEAARDWSGPILAAVGVSREQMPRLLEGNAPSGMLRPEIAAAWGLAHPVVVAAGGRGLGRRRGWHRRHQRGRRLHLAWHLGADLRRPRPLPAEAGDPDPRLRPRLAQPLVRAGGAPQRRRLSRLGRAASRRD